MIDVDTNKPKILRGVANYIITPSSNGISEDEIYIRYQFKNKDTKNKRVSLIQLLGHTE